MEHFEEKLKSKSGAGFTMIELMVSISIFFIVTGIILSNYPKFGNNLALESLAQDMALSIRQAQVFGSAILGTGQNPTQIFNAYGAYFPDPGAVYRLSGQTYTYTIFADIPDSIGENNFNYDRAVLTDCGRPRRNSSEVNECAVEVNIKSNRNKVEKLCQNFYRDNNPPFDSVLKRINNCQPLKSLNVVFLRPNLEANFTAVDNNDQPVDTSSLSNVAIVIDSVESARAGIVNKRAVVVWRTGQISVERVSQ